MRLGELIKKYRKLNGLTYLDIEKATGIAKSSLQRYEIGKTSKIPLKTIEKLAKVFNISPSQLVGWEDKKNKNTDTKELTRKFELLDEKDKIKVDAYIDGMLENEKYKSKFLKENKKCDIS